MAKNNTNAKEKGKNDTVLVSQANFIKEKSYLAREIETSIKILESPENEVVLDALLFLSKYADIKPANLNYLQLHGIIPKLMALLSRNICILRLALRLLRVLLTEEDAVCELEEEKYDNSVMEIANMFINNEDTYVRKYSLEILGSLACSFRCSALIFNVDLFNPIFDIVKSSNDNPNVEACLKLLLGLIDAPGAVSKLPDVQKFEPIILMKHIDNPEDNICKLVYEILRKLTFLKVEALQEMFKNARLVERMLELLMDPFRKIHHQKIIDIITNCSSCEETSSYFVESIEFLDFCVWVKTCDTEYLYPSIVILEKLTKIVELRQLLFDLSVEDSLMFFLRSEEKRVLNLTCKAITNMSSNKYCCERMLTPVVIKKLIAMLKRNDLDEDVQNEVALKTLFDFTRRMSIKALDMIYVYEGTSVIVEYFKKGTEILSKESFLMVLEILDKYILHSQYYQAIVSDIFFQEILNHLLNPAEEIALLSLEIMTNCVPLEEFRRFFLSTKSPEVLIEILSHTKNPGFFKNILVFIYSILMYDNMVETFISKKLLLVFKAYPKAVRDNAPLIQRISNVLYNVCLPLKFFETGQLAITDRFKNRFYLINGPWKDYFPFLEVLEILKVSTICSIYVVDYSYRPIGENLPSAVSKAGEFFFQQACNEDTNFCESICPIQYGQLSPDPYLPKYISYFKGEFKVDTEAYINICLSHKIKLLASFIDTLLCGPKEDSTLAQKFHTYHYHIQSIKTKLGTNMIPIGYLRIGFHCERALLFKAIADKIEIPASLVKGKNKIYWNEVALIDNMGDPTSGKLQKFVVDLMYKIGELLPLGSREANSYCYAY